LSSKSLPTLNLRLEDSPRLRVWTGLVHGVSLLAVLVTDGPLWMQGGLMLATGFSFFLCQRQHRHLAGTRLTLEPEGYVSVHYPVGTHFTGILQDSTVATTQGVILRIRTDRGTHALLISRDATDPESYRRLRVVLTCLPRPRRSPVLPF